MRLSGRKSYKNKAKMKKLGSFGKKWKPGDKLRVLYRVFFDEEENSWEALVADCYGHSLDPQATTLKRVYIPSLAEINEYGEPITQDYSFQFARIARWILQGQRKREEADIKSNKGMSESAKDTSLTKIKNDYEKKKPILGSLELRISTECYVIPVDKNDIPDFENASLCSQDLGFSKLDAIAIAANTKEKKEIFIDTEITVDYDASGISLDELTASQNTIIINEVAKYKSMPSIPSTVDLDLPAATGIEKKTLVLKVEKKIDYLKSLLSEDSLSTEQRKVIETEFEKLKATGATLPLSFHVMLPKFFKDPENEFIEISYAFKNKEDRSQAGKITPLGVDPANALSCHPEYKDRIYGFVGQLPEDSDIIKNRNSSFRPVGESEIKQALSTYAAMKYKDLDALEDDEVTVENMKKNVDLFKIFSIPVSIPVVVEELEKLKAEEPEEAAKSGAPTIDQFKKKDVDREAIEYAKAHVEENLGEIMEQNGLEIQTDITEQ